MFKPGRNLLTRWAVFMCAILLIGGMVTGLRRVAAEDQADVNLASPSNLSQVLSTFDSVSTAGPITVHGVVARNSTSLRFRDMCDLPESENISSNNLSSGQSAKPVVMIQSNISHDGTQKFVTAYKNTNNSAYVSVRSQNGKGQFSASVMSPLPDGTPVAMNSADFNMDGQADLAVLYPNSKIAFLAGNGAGSFAYMQDLAVLNNASAFAIGDVAHRGLDGIVVGSSTGEFQVIAQKDTSEEISKAISKSFKASASIVGMELVDINNDGNLDLVLATSKGVEIWEGSGDTNFALKTKLATSSLSSIALGSLDVDSLPGIVAAANNGTVYIWKNTKGTFGQPQVIQAAQGATRVKLDYVDVDAYRDIVVVDRDNSEVAILVNKKGQSFESPVTLKVDSNPVDLTIGRFDEDGYADFVIAKQGNGSQAAALTYVPNQAGTIVVTDLSNRRNIAANGTMVDIQARVTAKQRITFLDALTAANNSPGGQTIVFQVSEASSVNALDGGNYREPPNITQSIQFPNTLVPVADGHILYNVNLIGGAALNSILSLEIRAATGGDGTVIIGENLGGTNYIGETTIANINKLGPDIRIVGDDTYNTAFEVAASNCRFENLLISGFTKSLSQGGVGASAIEFDGVFSQNNTITDCYLGSLDLFGSGNFLNGFGSFTNLTVAPRVLLGSRRGIHINGAGNTNVNTSSTFTGLGRHTLISGNRDHGILIQGGSRTNKIDNIYIGVLFNGVTPYGNGFDATPSSGAAGVELRNSATGTVISNNLISCSGVNGQNGAAQPRVDGILLQGNGVNSGPSNNEFTNNIVGLQFSGNNPPLFATTFNSARNTGYGVEIAQASSFNKFTENTISASGLSGVLIRDQSNNNTLIGNRIGTDSTGRLTNGGSPLSNERGNFGSGLIISDQSTRNTIDNNTISNNRANGIEVIDGLLIGHPGFQGTDGNQLLNNKVGTDSGATPIALGANLANGQSGVKVGTGPGGTDGNVQGNLFSKNLVYFNLEDGFTFNGDSCDLNQLTQNSIVANKKRGVRIVTFQTGPNREGPLTPSGQFAQEKGTVTNEDDGVGLLPETPGVPPATTSLPRAAIIVDSALSNGGLLQVTGRVGRKYITGGGKFNIEVFASNTSSFPVGQANSAGVAQRFLGSTTIASNVTPSTWTISTTGAQLGDVVTATLTSASGSTSEISVAKLVDQGPVSGGPSFSFYKVNSGTPFSLTPIGTNLDFGNVLVGTTSTATIRLLNTSGGVPLTVNSIVLTDAGGVPSQFTLQPIGIGFPQTLSPTTDPNGSPGSFIDFTVTTTPTSVGTKNGLVSLSLNTPVGQISTVSLKVNGITQQQQIIVTNPVAGSVIDFGNVEVGKTSDVRTVIISNTGTTPLQITLGLTPSDFLFDNSFVFPTTSIPAGSSITVPLRFRPVVVGTRTGTLSITHDAPNQTNPVIINLRGIGTSTPTPSFGVITINGVQIGNQIDFGNVPVGTTAKKQLLITNTGNANLTFSFLVTGNAFSGSVTNVVIVPNNSTLLDLTFTPPTTGDFTGTLSFTSNAINTPFPIALLGKGISSTISVNPSNVNFGAVAVGQPATQPVTITNTGNSVLTVNGLNLTGQGFQLQGAPAVPFQVQPGASQQVQVVFTPPASGNFTGSLVITSNASNTPIVTVNLSGSGKDNIVPVVTVTDPRSGQGFAAGSKTLVKFSATDNIGVTKIDVQLAERGNFSDVASGLPGNATSFEITFSQFTDTNTARIRVIAYDAAGNQGSAETGTFTIAPPPQIIGPKVTRGLKLKMQSAASNISLSGAVVIINNVEIPLTLNSTGTKFATISKVGDLIPKGVQVQLVVRNSNGVTGTPITFVR